MRTQKAIPVQNGLSFNGFTPICGLSLSGFAITVRLACCEFHSIGKCQPQLEEAIGVPEIARTKGSVELTGRMRVNTFSVLPWRPQLMPNLSECWHSA